MGTEWTRNGWILDAKGLGWNGSGYGFMGEALQCFVKVSSADHDMGRQLIFGLDPASECHESFIRLGNRTYCLKSGERSGWNAVRACQISESLPKRSIVRSSDRH